MHVVLLMKCLWFALQNEAECSYYLRTGQCKFGSTCKFHHPQPSNMMVSYHGSPVYPTVQSPTSPGQQSYQGVTNWSLSRASYISPRWQAPSNYTPMILPQGMVSVPGWSAYSVSFYTYSFIIHQSILVIISFFLGIPLISRLVSTRRGDFGTNGKSWVLGFLG